MANEKATQRREEVNFRVLRLVAQREIVEQLGVSLGAMNYCLRALLAKGHLKLADFKASHNN